MIWMAGWSMQCTGSKKTLKGLLNIARKMSLHLRRCFCVFTAHHRSNRKIYPSNMSDRTNFSSGSVWEDVVGYSRAVRVGNVIEVSGTVAADEDGNVIGRDDAFQQTIYILEKIGRVLKEAGA